MKSTVKHTIALGIAHYTAGSVDTDDVTNELFLLVCQKYYHEHGYLPKDWEDHLREVTRAAPCPDMPSIVLPQ